MTNPIREERLRREEARLRRFAHEDEFYKHLGRFISTYATAEGSAAMVARLLSGMSEERARIVFGRMRRAPIASHHGLEP
jgi:hypothetical protein